MSVKETIHQWVNDFPEDSPELRALYEQARLDQGIAEAMADVRASRVLTYEELMANYEVRCQQRASP